MDKIGYNQLYSKAKEINKEKSCMFCGKMCTSFCRSHSLPLMILERLKDNEPGTFFWGLEETDKPNILKEKTGKINAGNFFLICNDCDNALFKVYEDEARLLDVFTNEMLQRIRLKNNYYGYYKYSIETRVSEELFEGKNNLQLLSDNNRMYRDEFLREIQDISENIKNNRVEEYEILFWKKLDYVVPIAFQGLLSPYIDFCGNFIEGKLPEFHVVIFPLTKGSIVSVFCVKDMEMIQKIKFPTEIKDSKKLALINNMVLLFSEDFYLNRKVVESLTKENQARLKKICYGFTMSKGWDSKVRMMEQMKEAITDSYIYPNLLGKFNCIR